MSEGVNEEDVLVSTFKSGTRCLVEVTHKATGIMTKCGVFSSEILNKNAAMNSLRDKIESLPGLGKIVK